MENIICPHLNCLVYHGDNPCNCDMTGYCPECSKEVIKTIDAGLKNTMGDSYLEEVKMGEPTELRDKLKDL